jgi:hypothetical protein
MNITNPRSASMEVMRVGWMFAVLLDELLSI